VPFGPARQRWRRENRHKGTGLLDEPLRHRTDPAEIRRAITRARFDSGGQTFELVLFMHDKRTPNILISQGSGGHTVDQLLARHRDAVGFIGAEFNDTIGVYSEGLGGYVVFYLALGHAPIGSIVCQNSPAIMTEPPYHDALLTDGGPWARSVRRRRLMMPVVTRLARVAPRMKVPISSYL
jgi:hypothetical protein